MTTESSENKHPLGALPPWKQDDLPEPLPFSFRNILHVIGPGAILLAASVGGGEWIAGPASAVKYSVSIMWLASVAIVLQLVFNLEGIRYTLYTGEPILVGIMRLAPGSGFWGAAYSIMAMMQLAIPSLAKGCAVVVVAALTKELTGEQSSTYVLIATYGVMLGAVALLCSGRTVERVLEVASWFMIVMVATFLLVVNIWIVPFSHWWGTIQGFLSFGFIPDAVKNNLADLPLLATLAATAGSGGIGNFIISSYMRDKGFGMGAKVGAIGGALAGDAPEMSHVGKVFPVNAENLRRWKVWWKYVHFDQVWVWAIGCLLGMYLNVNLASFLGFGGQEFKNFDAGTFQAQQLASKIGPFMFYLTLLNGFWILFSTHLGNTDSLARCITDLSWVAFPPLRESRRMSVSKVYYGLLAIITVVGAMAVPFGSALDLFKVLGVVANPLMALGAFQILRVNTTLLPSELRPGIIRRVWLSLCGLFYLSITALLLWKLIKG